MKTIYYLFFFGLLTLSFSCGNDDAQVDSEFALIGTWDLVSLSYEGSSSTQNPYGDDLVTTFEGMGREISTSMTFKDDNTYTSMGSYTIDLIYEFNGEEYSFPTVFDGVMGTGTWTLEGNVLTVVSDIEEEEEAVLTLENLTSSSFVMKQSVDRIDNSSGFEVRQIINSDLSFEK